MRGSELRPNSKKKKFPGAGESTGEEVRRFGCGGDVGLRRKMRCDEEGSWEKGCKGFGVGEV